jgi:hypothetical protein
MPSWKKVIVSGSDATLNSLNVISGVTGSLLGTGSWAVRAQSSSFASNASTAASASFATQAANAVTSSFINVSKDGVIAYFQPATNDGYNYIKFDSKINAGSDMGFILFQDDSEQTQGSTTEDIRFTIGAYNDFGGLGGHSDELWMQGGARLVHNVGNWDSEMTSIIGTASNKTSGDLYSWNKNNSQVMVMNFDGNLGIGLTPSVKLDISGSIRSEIESDGNFITLQATSQRIHYIKRSGQTLQFTSDGTNPYDVRFDSSNRSVYFATGSVGINTTSPQSKLHVASAGNTAGGTILIGSTTEISKWSYLVSTQFSSSQAQGFSLIGGFTNSVENRITIGGSIYEANPATSIEFYTYTSPIHSLGGIQRMVINNSGSVGIGTSSPIQRLHTEGRTLIQSSAGYLFDVQTTDANKPRFQVYVDDTNGVDLISGYDTTAKNLRLVAGNSVRMFISASGKIGVGTTALSGFASSSIFNIKAATADGNQLYIIQENDDRGWRFRARTDGHFYLQSSYTGTDTDRLMIKFDDGLVGISTTTNLSAKINFPASDYGEGINFYTSATSTNRTGIGKYVNELRFYLPTADYFTWYSGGPAGSEIMRVSGSGNVGIGSTSPAYKLDVNGSSRIVGDTYFGSIINFYQGDARIWVPNVGEALTVKQNTGNVGIGTTAPNGAKLHVHDTSGAIYLRLETSGSASEATFYIANRTGYALLGLSGADGNIITGTSAGDLNINNRTSGRINLSTTSTAAQLSISGSSGNVGIGTIFPAFKLDVNGTTRFRDIVRFKIDAWNLSDDGFNRFYFANAGRTYFGSGNGYEWRNDADSAIMVLTNGGNLGIGTTSPSYKLHVIGTGTTTNLGVVGNIRAGGTGTSGGEVIASGALGNGNYVSLRHDDTNGYITVTRTVYAGHLILEPYANVGIGSTSPQAKLDVIGDTFVKGVIFAYAGSAGNQVGGITWSSTDDGTLFLKASNVTKVNINSNGASYFNGGNVGIGTTSPTHKVQITTTDDNTYGLRVQGSTANAAGVWTGIGIAGEEANTKAAIIFEDIGVSYSRGKLHLAVNNATDQSNAVLADAKLTVSNTGNVGIGSTSPAEKLDVSGGGRFTGNIATTGGSIIATNSGVDGTFADAFVGRYSGNNAEQNAIQTSVSIIAQSSGFRFRASDGGGSSGRTTVLDLVRDRALFYTNVGIGTTAPDHTLDIVTTVNQSGLRVKGNVDNAIVFISSTATGGQEWRIQSTGGTSGLGQGKLFFKVGTTETAANIPLILYTDNSTNGGRVGIGTATPRVALDLGSANNRGQVILLGEVGANIRVGFGLDSGTAGMRIFTLNRNDQFIDLGGISSTDGTTWTRNHRFGIAGGNTSLNEQGGNVGIGTTAPNTKLQVQGIVRVQASSGNGFQIYDGATERMHIYHNSTLNGIEINTGATSNANMQFYVNGTTAMYISASGNVGVATSTPIGGFTVGGESGSISSHILSWGQSERYERKRGATFASGLIYRAYNKSSTTAFPSPPTEADFTIGIRNYSGTLRRTGVTANINAFTETAEYYYVEFHGLLYVSASQTYFFDCNSDDASDVFVDGKRVADYYGGHGASGLGIKGSIYLSQGYHKFYARFEEQGGGDTLTVQWSTDGGSTYATIPSAVFYHDPNDIIRSDGSANAYFLADVVAYSTSDARLKDNVTPLSTPIDRLMKLQGVDFTWKPDIDSEYAGKKDVGLIAQQVEEILPEAVETRYNGYKAVRYEKIIPLLVESVKELKSQNDTLQSRIQQLESLVKAR